ncbi:hypothetical protein MUK42_36794 [Musa troglodytarum]|uniref:Uncharacterized protein n=1 Tax=Musa troglodytarum TaxID=320322 RepID=A0A9E7JDE8_9LILI|nr:hypothetical protein MUK42_36794 [Musa troglodytarum]
MPWERMSNKPAEVSGCGRWDKVDFLHSAPEIWKKDLKEGLGRPTNLREMGWAGVERTEMEDGPTSAEICSFLSKVPSCNASSSDKMKRPKEQQIFDWTEHLPRMRGPHKAC